MLQNQTLIYRFFTKYFANDYITFILESKFKVSLTWLINYSYILILSFTSSFIILGTFLQEAGLVVLGLGCIPLGIFVTTRIFDEVISNELQQFDLDCIFILRELLILSTTTKSESQAYFLLASNSNKLLNKIGKAAFIERNIDPMAKIDVISSHLKKLEKSAVQKFLQSIFTNWTTAYTEVKAYTRNFQKLMQTKLDEDFHNLETKATIVNAIIGVFPILTVFLVFIGFKNIHPLLEMLVAFFCVVLLLLLLLDPYHFNAIHDFFGPIKQIENFAGTTILQEFFSYLLVNQNFGKSLQEFVLKSSTIDSAQKKDFVLFLNFMNNDQNIANLIDLITRNKGSKLQFLFKLLYEVGKIDINTILLQFPDFIANYSSIEQYYKKKYFFLKTEKKKSYLLILLNSFTLGILGVILPYLFFINSYGFTAMQKISVTIQTPRLELVITIEFFILLIILYAIYYSVFSIKSKKILLKNIVLVFLLFLGGFLFSIALLKPILVFM